jgi:hypothetical protein
LTAALWVLSVFLLPVRGLFIRGKRGQEDWYDQSERNTEGRALNAAISNAIVDLLGEYIGRGPTKARTINSGRFVLCVLEDTMTKAERSLMNGGHEENVLQAHHALQQSPARSPQEGESQ